MTHAYDGDRLDAATDGNANSALILLVEDDDDIREGLVEVIELAAQDWPLEIEVACAPDGVAALDWLRTKAPDLIVSDISMPRMDGYELLSAVRVQPPLVHTPFIFLTAYADGRSVARGRHSGAELYVTKPFETNNLLDIIRSRVELSLQRRSRRNLVEARVRRAVLRIFQHEFRTPAASITGYSEILHQSVSLFDRDLELVRELVQGLQGGSRRLLRLLHRLRLVLEIESGEYAAHVEPRFQLVDDIAPLIRSSVGRLVPEAKRRAIAVDTELQAPLGPVYGHRPSLGLVLDELLANALRFTAASDGARRVTVIGSNTGDAISIDIRDTGIGFPGRIQREIFDLFYQHDRELGEQQGPGVGLTIARGLVHLHGGQLSAAGRPRGGARLRIVLPTAAQKASSHGSASVTAAGTYGRKQREAAILVVEDDEALRLGLAELLQLTAEQYQLHPYTAADGIEALELLEKQRIDLILSDMRMPRMGGPALLEAVRRRPEWVNIPFIFMTAVGDRIQGLKLGADEYITKPYETDALLLLINTRLGRFFDQQGAVDAEFEALKYDILGSLPADFESRLHAVVDQSAAFLALLNAASSDDHDEQLHSVVRQISAESSSIKDLVTRFTDLVGLLTGSIGPAPSRPVETVSEWRTLIAALAPENRPCSVMLAKDVDDKPLVADRRLLERALQQLLYRTDELGEPGAPLQVAISVDVETQQHHIRMRIACSAAPDIGRMQAIIEHPSASSTRLTQRERQLLLTRRLVALLNGRLEITGTDSADNGGFTVQLSLTLPTSPMKL